MTCLRGASAVDSLLSRHQAAAARVLAIWQPMLAGDRFGPRRWALNALTDHRVRQYWDPNHIVARRLAADARPPQPELECCTRGDIIWDMAAVYPPGALWEDRLPPAVVFNGPVVDIMDAIDGEIRRGLTGKSSP